MVGRVNPITNMGPVQGGYDSEAELKLYDLESLSELMDRALLLEEKNWALRKGGYDPNEKGRNIEKDFKDVLLLEAWRSKSFTQRQKGPKEPKPPNGQGGEKKTPIGRKLSQAELQERSRKGLCFKCGEKWGLEHVCKLKHYQLVLLEDQEEEIKPEEEEGDEVPDLENKTLQLSLRSKVGLTSPKSFKLKLPLEVTPEYTVEIGTSEKVKGRGLCRGVELEVTLRPTLEIRS
ncbi:hypothetical protein SESBI_01414 [Sesbania bispinosa]|nr:hypothetical protein SESBI_01414 [Sesbania bispinosa]